jgi:PTS system nitrogen regulatory IIA component
MDMGAWLDKSAIIQKAHADSKRHALAITAELAARAFGAESGAVFDALCEREAQSSTGVGYGVAVPHARLPGLDGMRAVFVRLDKPVPFDSLDDQPVDLILALFAPIGADSEHLRALARVSRQLRKAEVREQLRKAASADSLHALLAQEATSSAA